MVDTETPDRKESSLNKDWTRGPIVSNLLRLSWPMVLMETLFVVSQVADMVWVGQLGPSAIAGVGIANIDSYGNVHPDQFWQTHTLGNVRERPFSELWSRSTDPLLAGLRNRLPLLKGRCQTCRWQPLCGGSFRVRAFQATGDPWAPDPACYLTDEEIR